MEDEFDISCDLDESKARARKDTKIIRDLKAEIEELKIEIAGKELEKQLLSSKSGVLLENISSVLLTTIRRQAGDTSLLGMDSRIIKKCDKATQTTVIQTINRHVQVDSLGTVTESSWTRKTQTEPCRHGNRWRERERSYERKGPWMPVNRRDWTRENFAVRRWDRGWQQDRRWERERERRVRCREVERSPEVSPVYFPQPLRKSRQERDRTDVNLDTKLSEMFIPMNQQELDQYVKGTAARGGNRSPDEGCSRSDEQRKDTLDTANSELWDAEMPENFIQSDEIGTTRSIMEQLPEMLLDKDPGQNDNRKLRTLASGNESISFSETLTAKLQKVEDVKLEEGEMAHLNGDSVINDVDHGRSSLILSDSAEDKRKKATKKKSKREAKTSEDSFRHERKKKEKRSKNDPEHSKKSKLGPVTVNEEVPKMKFNAKSKKEKLNELFGSDDDDDVLCVPPKTVQKKLSMSGGESIDSKMQNVRSEEKNAEDTSSAEIQYLVSANEMDTSNHSAPLQTDVFIEEDSLGCTLLEEATSKEELASTSHQERPPMFDASVVEIPEKSSQQDQPLRVNSPELESAKAMDSSTAKTSSSNEILPPDDPVDAFPARTCADASKQVHLIKSPEVAVFFNKYSEFRVEENNETETTIYMTRKKKKKNKSDRASLNTTVISLC